MGRGRRTDGQIGRQADRERQRVIASPYHFKIIAKGNETQKERNDKKKIKRRNKKTKGGKVRRRAGDFQ